MDATPALTKRAAFSDAVRQSITALYRGKCQYCGAPNSNVIEHIIPLAKGGTNALTNLTLACRDCNAKKSAHLLPEAYSGILLARAQAKEKKLKGMTVAYAVELEQQRDKALTELAEAERQRDEANANVAFWKDLYERSQDSYSAATARYDSLYEDYKTIKGWNAKDVKPAKKARKPEYTKREAIRCLALGPAILPIAMMCAALEQPVTFIADVPAMLRAAFGRSRTPATSPVECGA